MAQDQHSPESVLEELCRTGHRWMEARVDERRHGPSTIEATAGDNPPSYAEPDEESRAVGEAHRLRDRFRRLAREFVDRMEAQ